MTAPIVQVQYDTLEDVIKRFDDQADDTSVMIRGLLSAVEQLRGGAWAGEAATSFYREMDEEIFPTLERLEEAFVSAGKFTGFVIDNIQTTEEEAANQFQLTDSGGTQSAGSYPGFGGAGSYPGFGGAGSYPGFGGAGSYPGFGGAGSYPGFGGAGGYGPTPPWLTAPFAAGAATLGPGPVPILGSMGRVPAGYNNPGSRLWLYPGGQGTDTIFSIQPRDGWGRAGYKPPTPNVRLDYGEINIKPTKSSYFPDGTPTNVPRNQNFFHWNTKGQGSNKVSGIWQTNGNKILDHQLMRNQTPRSNVIGPVRGAGLVRGASRTLGVVGAGMDIYSVATADNKVQEGVRRGAAWGGAWAGAKGGAAVGATVGTFVGGPVGTAVGGAVGGVVGGVGGYFAGYEVGDKLYDAGSAAVDFGKDAVGAVGDAAGDAADAVGGFVSDPVGTIGGWWN